MLAAVGVFLLIIFTKCLDCIASICMMTTVNCELVVNVEERRHSQTLRYYLPTGTEKNHNKSQLV